MTITSKTTVGEIAKTIPTSVAVFQRHGIDFCCGGNKPLEEACQEKGVSVDQIVSEVDKTRQPAGGATARDWNSASLSELIQHILDTHHAYLHSEMPRLEQMLAKVIAAHGEKHPESLQPLARLYAGLTTELWNHMGKEENILFPLIQQMEQASQGGRRAGPTGMSIESPIRVMEMEHESAGSALEQMRQVTDGYQVPADGCATYRALLEGLERLEADLHVHIHLENNILFPRALELETALVS
ncbi:MAG: iron-sulfur cluster repair di-iron protein [Acidobacteria bacterium RIFCSPLOWO2_02_FULL_59_13]|nr:MAG: iron-sulfur cluster repair di-iron protein [Acidobacteria bacterium RIFCSPLOWO2_02_FULL_59_13]